jgi:hypothetical protein
MFYIPWLGIIIVVSRVVTPILDIGIYYPLKWVIVLEKPNRAYLREIYTVWIKFYPSLAHF